MSSSAFIDINFKKQFPLNALKALSVIEKTGWRLDDQGKIVYLPFNDNDNFNWTAVTQNNKHLFLEELKKKQNSNEPIGVVLTYENTQIGGNALFLFKENQLSLSLNINTKFLDTGIADFIWYREKLESFIKHFKEEIDSIHICQSDSGGRIEFSEILSANGDGDKL